MEINHEIDSHAVPFNRVLEALNIMQYASDVRAMFQMLFLTGCRMKELDNMQASMIYGNVIYWHLGKNQRGFRKVRLPNYFVRELREYRNTHRVYGGKLFGIDAHTFRRYFAKFIRPRLPSWQEKRFRDKCGVLEPEYIYQLKGLRKDFQTLEFARQLDKWKDASVALEFTSKGMKHSSTRITAKHYIENFESLDIERYKHLTPGEILSAGMSQMRLMDY
ncbi:MAG: hypothetical protein QME12_06605 [Nanoarchaeota archaeon]|nr:hypothetical protein [Nanoarchaeota archaeon]